MNHTFGSGSITSMILPVKTRPHQQQCRSNTVECYKSNVASTKSNFTLLRHRGRFWCNNVKRVFRKILLFGQSRNKRNMLNSFRLCCRNDEILRKTRSNGNNVEATFDFVERIHFAFHVYLCICFCAFVHCSFYIFLLSHFCIYVIVPLFNSVMQTVTV